MPGEAKIKARLLRPVGAKYATKDIGIAKDLATNMLHQALFCSPKEGCAECDGSVMSIVKAFCDHARKFQEEGRPNIVDAIKNGEIQLLINTPSGKHSQYDDSYIRKAAIKYRIPYITTAAAAVATAAGIAAGREKTTIVKSLQSYHADIEQAAVVNTQPG